MTVCTVTLPLPTSRPWSVALCRADRSTFHAAHQPPESLLAALGPGKKESFSIKSAGIARRLPSRSVGRMGPRWRGWGGSCWCWRGAPLLPPAWPAKHVTSCSEGLLAPFQAPDIADGDTDTEAMVETDSQPSDQQVFPSVRVCVHLYFSISCTCSHPGPKTAYRQTQILSEGSCSLRWDRINFSPKPDASSRTLIIVCFPLHCACCCLYAGLAGTTTISPDLSRSFMLLEDQSVKFPFLLSLQIHVPFARGLGCLGT